MKISKVPEVGDKFNGWTIGRIDEWPKYWDLVLVNVNGAMGSHRMFKSEVLTHPE